MAIDDTLATLPKGPGKSPPLKRTSFGMLERCEKADKYEGKKDPDCGDDGKGCIACWRKHHEYVAAHRPKMSADFREFYDFAAMQKRLFQVAGQGGGFDNEDYRIWAAIEKMIRTGDYRHNLAAMRKILEEIHYGGSPPKRTAKKR